MFQKRRIPTKYKKRVYSKTQKKLSGKTRGRLLLKILFFLTLSLIILGAVGAFIIYSKYIEPLPDVNELERQEIAEASIIYDRDGNELYKIFKEKRTYRDFTDINTNMIDAIVAGEDKRYWENPGVDLIGLVRAVIYRVTGRTDKIEGTSTLTQQLIRNMVITNERTAERKIKEMYLAYNLTENLTKEKIIELYLNKISFGSNAFGIEQAAQTFFSKSAKDLGVLEASILASLPKGPSYYSPYSNYERLVGYPYIYPTNDAENTTSLTTQEQLTENSVVVKKFTDFIGNLKLQRLTETRGLLCGLDASHLKTNISFDADGCSVMDYSEFLTLLNSVRIEIEEKEYIFEYQTGRKDFILGRMLEDEYIDFDEYKDSLISSVGLSFSKYKEDIKHPHFVFYVREYLEEKYGKDILEQGGLRIYTSLDPKLQKKAEEIVSKYAKSNEQKYAANNAALISLDNKTGEVLAMVGGRDYFDEEKKGNVNITTSRLQPGSTFKPFVYSIAIDKEIIGSKTPIYDTRTTFPGNYTPENFDGRFDGKMNISTALNKSRNVPAVKMYYIAGGEKDITDWMTNLGVASIANFKNEYFEKYEKEYSYGASMSLGTAPMTPLELASAYSVYANMGYKKEIQPIIKIFDSRGLVIEDNQSKEGIVGEEIIDPSTAFITNHILSDTSTRPERWNKFLSLPGRPVAAKTGTSTKQYEENGEKVISPRNLWTVGYTPQITTVVWAGNNDGTVTNFEGSGLGGAGPIWKDFMEFAHEGREIIDWKQPTGVNEVGISNISGKLPGKDFPSKLVIRSYFKNIPQFYDSNLQATQVDLFCNGKVGKDTPISAIGNVTYFKLESLRPNLAYWENPVQNLVRSGGYSPDFLNGIKIINSIPELECERSSSIPGETTIGTNIENNDIFHVGGNYVEIGYRSNKGIQKVDVYLGETLITELKQGNKQNGFFSGNINIPNGTSGRQILTIRAIDVEYYSQGITYNINVLPKDKIAPSISILSPSSASITLNNGDNLDLNVEVQDRSAISAINVYIAGEIYSRFNSGNSYSTSIPSTNFNTGYQEVIVEAVDNGLNKSQKTIGVSLLPSTPSVETPTQDSPNDDTDTSDIGIFGDLGISQ